MKSRRLWSVLLTIFILGLHASMALSLDVPPLNAHVNDLATMLDESSAAQLEARLEQFEQQTHYQIAILTVPSLAGDGLEDFGIRVADSWKIGHKGADDGVIMIVARDDRKIRIEVGYGLEGILPDAIANRIIQDVIVPRFRDQDFVGGISSGVTAIIQASGGEPSTVSPRTSRPWSGPTSSGILTLLVATAVLGSLVGFSQPNLVRGALHGALVTGVIALPGMFAVGIGVWLIAVLLGAICSLCMVQFARRAWGRPWTARPSSPDSYSPRDTFHRGYGGGSGADGGTNSAGGSSGGFSGGGGGGFGGGGASGGW